jgi:hypothetical protein
MRRDGTVMNRGGTLRRTLAVTFYLEEHMRFFDSHGGALCWLLRISVPKNASLMTLSDPFLLHLYIGQMAIELLTLLCTALFENGYPSVASTGWEDSAGSVRVLTTPQLMGILATRMGGQAQDCLPSTRPRKAAIFSPFWRLSLAQRP